MLIQTKVCTKCGKELPVIEEWFYKQKNGKFGLSAECKNCKKKYQKENKEKIKEKKSFYYKQNKKAINAKQKEYYNENRDVILEQKKNYWITNQQKIKKYREVNKQLIQKYKTKYNRKYYNIKQDQILQQKKEYYIFNKEKIKEYQENNKNRFSLLRKNRYKLNRDKELQRDKLWRQNNKEKVRIYCQEYRAKKNGLPATLTINEWEDIKEKFNHQCAYCGKPSEKLTQEHFIALSKGGDYTKTNIIPACKSCNSSKHDRKPIEWYRQQDFYSSDRLNKIIGYFNANGKSFWEYGSLGVTRSLEEVSDERI